MHLGLIGAGNISATHLRAAQMVPGVVVSAVYSPTLEKARRLAEMAGAVPYADLEDFLSHKPLDIVAIGSPSGMHAEQAIAAAGSGLHALVEKPLDISTARVDAVIAAAERHGVRVGVFFQDRLKPDVVRVKQMVDEGRLGRPGAGLRTREVASAAGVLRRFELAWHAGPRWRRRVDEPGHPHGGSAAVAVWRGRLGVGGGRRPASIRSKSKTPPRRSSPFAAARSASSKLPRRCSPAIRDGSS